MDKVRTRMEKIVERFAINKFETTNQLVYSRISNKKKYLLKKKISLFRLCSQVQKIKVTRFIFLFFLPLTIFDSSKENLAHVLGIKNEGRKDRRKRRKKDERTSI